MELKATERGQQMSELKVIDLGNIRESIEKDEPVYYEYYAKSEADKVFADKDKAFEYAQAVILVDIGIIKKQKRKRCLVMAEWCESTALWCYQAANTLPEGFHATLYGKPVMIEPDRLFKRFVLLKNWSKLWRKLAEKFK